MTPPNCEVPQLKDIKLYHIVHIDRLASIIQIGGLLSDAIVKQNSLGGSTIGMQNIKDRRLRKSLKSYPELTVGSCVPFYFCPRSIMLYVIAKRNHVNLSYRGGQEPIIHLVVDFSKAIAWSEQNKRRWVFTSSNAGSHYFEDYNSVDKLHKIDWKAVENIQWQNCADTKQAEFLLEHVLPWELIESISVYSDVQYRQVNDIIARAKHRPRVRVERQWYY